MFRKKNNFPKQWRTQEKCDLIKNAALLPFKTALRTLSHTNFLLHTTHDTRQMTHTHPPKWTHLICWNSPLLFLLATPCFNFYLRWPGPIWFDQISQHKMHKSHLRKSWAQFLKSWHELKWLKWFLHQDSVLTWTLCYKTCYVMCCCSSEVVCIYF